MFQDFSDASDGLLCAPRVAALRATFPLLGVDGVIVPRADEHQGEYVPHSADRLKFITGFTGSAGAAIILKDRAVLLVDGRYTLQAAAQTDAAVFTIDSLVESPPHVWLEAHGKGLVIGFDPWLHTSGEAERLRKAAEKGGFTLKPLEANPVDAVWPDRPKPPKAKAVTHPTQLAGVGVADKLKALSADIAKAGADAALLSDPSSLAWAFNLRGRDLPHVPVALGFAVLRKDGPATIHWPQNKLAEDAKAALAGHALLRPRDALLGDLVALAKTGAVIALDPGSTPEAVHAALQAAGARTVALRDPVVIRRAQKNPIELEGARAAHLRDGAAMAAFLCWLDARKPSTVDEIAAVKKLESIRKANALAAGSKLEDVSFASISGAGPNGAIIHYSVTEATNRVLESGELFLIDSGGQYLDGTTDITRTVAIGDVAAEARRAYALVLKGMIAVSRARFPKGTRGVDLDVLARKALWEAGLDYAHGTGHGVGSFLSVHEGPQSISKRGMEPLLPGMILSNEPGYYRPGAFGIRIENLIIVREAETPEGGEIPMHGFETLTLCPLDRRLIDTSLLERAELQWIDGYHARVLDALAPQVSPAVRRWLKRACAPLPKRAKGKART
jgi:Xaa-Pro aminopeptidase